MNIADKLCSMSHGVILSCSNLRPPPLTAKSSDALEYVFSL